MLTVLMATFNGAPTLPKVLDAYCRLAAPPGGWSLLIVDDGSSDGTRALLDAYRGRLPLRCLAQQRAGKNAALNLAITTALAQEGDPDSLFVFTDDDATPAPDWLLRWSDCARAQPRHAVFGGAIEADWGCDPPAWLARLVPCGLTYGITTAAEGPVFPGLVWGANMAVRRAVFERGHRFDAAVGPNAGAYAMGSETEFTRRLEAAGYRAWFCAAARVAHFIQPAHMTRRYTLQRAFRYGRGARVQERPDGSPRLFGAPRWMFAKLAGELAGAVKDALRRDADAVYRRRWELHFLAGFLGQAWFGRHAPAAQRPRVLITSCSGELGGMEMRMAQEARLLNAHGCDAIFATPHFDGFERLAQGLRRDGVQAALFDPPQFFERWSWRRANLLRARLFGARAMRRHRPDLVHVAFCWTSYGASLLWLAHHCRLPSVISVHNAFPPDELSRWHLPLYRAAFSSVRGVYAVSASAMAHFMAIFGAFLPSTVRLAVIPNCVDSARFVPSPARRASARERLGLAPDALVLGSVARLSRQKRPHALIALFCALRPRFPGLVLVLAGAGPMEAALKRKVAVLGLGSCVVFAGRVDAVEDMLPAFDLHLLLSKNEGFGIATIEAMACGVPAVGTDVPGSADILRESGGGLLVPLADARATIEAVATLLADAPRRQRMGIAGRAEVEAAYTPAIMARRVEAFYAGLLP